MNTETQKRLTHILLIVIIVYFQHIQLTYSASISIKNCITMDIAYLLLNMMITILPFSILLLMTKKIIKSLMLSSIFITVLSLINYHVFLFHGTPFLAADINNITTAFDVITAYKPVFDSMVFRLLLILVFEMIVLLIEKSIYKKMN